MKKRIKDDITGWIYVLPSLITVIGFVGIPIVMSMYYSLCDYNVIQAPTFVGIKNYITAINDKYILASMKNTIVYTVLTVPAQTFLSMGIAAVIAEYFRGKFGGAVKSALFIPVISSALLVGTLWSMILANSGMVNTMLNAVGIESVKWLSSSKLAMVSVCIVAVWKNVGYFLVIFYAGMMDIPKSYYEAAQVDGATRMQRFTKITLPCLKPITYLVVTLGIIWSFNVFDMVYALTGGGPGYATTTLVLNIYNSAFAEYRMGYASAVAIILFALILIFNALQKLFFKKDK